MSTINTNSGEHHQHLRKRSCEVVAMCTPQTPWKRTLDRAALAFGILGPLMTGPQVWKIWVEQSASGVSAFSWTFYLITAVFWLTYGIAHNEKPIILTQSLWIVIDLIVILGTFVYS